MGALHWIVVTELWCRMLALSPWEPCSGWGSQSCGAVYWLSVHGSPTVNGGHRAVGQCAGSQSMGALHWIVVTELWCSVLALSPWEPCTGLWSQSCGAVCWLSVLSLGALQRMAVTELWGSMLALSPWEPCTGLWSQRCGAVCWLSVHGSPTVDGDHRAMW